MSSFVSAVELARRIAARELSPVEVVDGCIERIERRNPELNAFVLTAFDEAREAARAAERAVVAGAELGPLLPAAATTTAPGSSAVTSLSSWSIRKERLRTL
jgi:amidase